MEITGIIISLDRKAVRGYILLQYFPWHVFFSSSVGALSIVTF